LVNGISVSGGEEAPGPQAAIPANQARLGTGLRRWHRGQSAVICALFGHTAVAVDQEIWNALGHFGQGSYVSEVVAAGYPVSSACRPFIRADRA
jgi:hypothetical protein